MRVKRYVVDSLPEAVSLIRTELGKDAVILDTKQIKVGGFIGLFSKKRMEVTAAVETVTAPSATQAQQRPSASDLADRNVQAAVEQILQTARRPAQQATEAAEAAVKKRPIIQEPSPAVAAVSSASSSQATAIANAQQSDQVLQEIRSLRQQMKQIAAGQPQALPPALQQLKQRLLAQEVGEELIEQILTYVQQAKEDATEELSVQEAWDRAAHIIAEWLAPYAGASIEKDTKVLHFVGPTGVGKTTTIAKLAAEQTIKKGRSVAFITSDTYRIAAVDQLRTYANILNVPMEVVFSPKDLPLALSQLAEAELIFMDTAGRNFRNELHVSEVNSLLQTGDSSETILVLGLTGKTSDMSAVAAHFSHFGVRKVLFTKLDETFEVGCILNLVLSHGLLPTYLTSGQTVPDDIESFDIDKYIKLLLGEPEDE